VMAIYLTQVLSTMHGGTIEDPGPGFAAMAALAPQATSFEQSSAIMSKYVREGRVWATPFWSGRAQLLKDANVPVDYTIPKEGTVPLIATLNVPVGAKNKEGALAFVNFFLEKASQEAWVTGYNVGSIRNDLDLPKDVREKQITTKADIEKLLLPDFKMIAAKRAEWGDRWKREVSAAAD
jgi:putative spermidine/putrescine transport system substrate-binding protein